MTPRERRLLARTISKVENRSGGYEEVLRDAYRQTETPAVIGITGPPGVGKSTLVDALASHWARSNERIAILAVDPASPYSGGAILGDRIRLSRGLGAESIYFRSLSSRGHVGGLSRTINDIVAVLSLFEFHRIIIETVGAGQADTAINDTADCTVVVMIGNLGDGVQASKAGLMEIADVFVVNKADLPGAEEAERFIRNMLAVAYPDGRGSLSPSLVTVGIQELRRRHGDPTSERNTWVPSVLRLSAQSQDEPARLVTEIDAFLAWLAQTGRNNRARRARARAQIINVLSEATLTWFLDGVPNPVDQWAEHVVLGESDPIEAAKAMLRQAPKATL
jgi:LAO/AO transport system kinase